MVNCIRQNAWQLEPYPCLRLPTRGTARAGRNSRRTSPAVPCAWKAPEVLDNRKRPACGDRRQVDTTTSRLCPSCRPFSPRKKAFWGRPSLAIRAYSPLVRPADRSTPVFNGATCTGRAARVSLTVVRNGRKRVLSARVVMPASDGWTPHWPHGITKAKSDCPCCQPGVMDRRNKAARKKGNGSLGGSNSACKIPTCLSVS